MIAFMQGEELKIHIAIESKLKLVPFKLHSNADLPKCKQLFSTS